MTRTRVMSQGKEGRNADFMQTARDNPHKAEARIGASAEAGTRGLTVSVERVRVPGDAVPGNAVPRNAVPGDAVPRNAVPGNAVPGKVIPGNAIPQQGVPGEQEPGNAAEKRILPAQRRTKEDRVQRAGEAVRRPEPLIGPARAIQSLERAAQEPALHDVVVGPGVLRG